MAFLFQVTGKAVFPNVETLLISPFKEIWERDKTKDKRVANEEFAYMEFMTSRMKSNPFKNYRDKDKEAKVRGSVITNPKWKPDKMVNAGMQRIVDFQKNASTTYNFFMSAKKGIEKLQGYYDDLDFKEVHPKTLLPLNKPKEVTSALIDTEKILTNFKSLESKVEEELYEKTKNRADKEISPLADPESLME